MRYSPMAAKLLELSILKAVELATSGRSCCHTNEIHGRNADSTAIVCSRDKSGNLQQAVPYSDGM